jgi:hypothetical protein
MKRQRLILGMSTMMLFAWTYGESPAQGDDSTAQHKPTASSIYAVAEYDPERDPFKDLANVVAGAEAANKRILLEVGG